MAHVCGLLSVRHKLAFRFMFSSLHCVNNAFNACRWTFVEAARLSGGCFKLILNCVNSIYALESSCACRLPHRWGELGLIPAFSAWTVYFQHLQVDVLRRLLDCQEDSLRLASSLHHVAFGIFMCMWFTTWLYELAWPQLCIVLSLCKLCGKMAQSINNEKLHTGFLKSLQHTF